MNRLPHIAIFFAAIILVAADEKDKQPKITLEKVRVQVKKAAEICRTTKPPTKPVVKEQGGYLDAIQPILSQGKKALPKLQKLLSSEKLDLFEKHVMRIIIERIKYPSRFQKITPHLLPYKGNPLDDLKKSVRDQDRRHVHGLFHEPWYIKSPAYDVELLHKDYSDLIKEYANVYQEINAAGKLLWKDAQASKQRDEKALKSVLKSYSVKIGTLRTRHRIPYSNFNKLVDISPYIDPIFTDQLRFNPVYRLAWEEAMVRPFPFPKKYEYLWIVSKIDNPESAPSVAEFLRQTLVHPHRRSEVLDLSNLPFTCEALGRWASHDNAIVISELLASVKGEGKSKLEIHMGANFSKSKKWKDIITKIKMDPKMNEHSMRLDAAIKAYAKYMEPLNKSIKKKVEHPLKK